MDDLSIAYFVTSHGFGHASRAAAVMAAMRQRRPRLRFELFTTCPPWIFTDTIKASIGIHPVQTDLGMVQLSPMVEDLEATCCALDRWLPFDAALVNGLAEQLSALNCRLVVCDISALGIASAQKAGLPSVLVENFTWDWIYQSYAPNARRLEAHARYLGAVYDQASIRIQTEPLCRPLAGTCRVNPICRWPRSSPEQIRASLGIHTQAKMVLVSMGGVPDHFDFLDRLPPRLDLHIVIAGADDIQAAHPKVILLPAHNPYFHPDLLNAADILIGKAGYSTIAEANHVGVPFGYLNRPQFPESPYLERFIQSRMHGLPISVEDYHSGRWIMALPDLIAMPRSPSPLGNGAHAVADILCQMVG